MLWIRINAIASFVLGPLQILAITRTITIDEQALYYLVTPAFTMGYLIEFNSSLLLAGDSSSGDCKISQEAASIYNYLVLTIPALLSLSILYFIVFQLINLNTLILALLASLDVVIRTIFINVEKKNSNKSFQIRTIIQLAYSSIFILTLVISRNVLLSLVCAFISKRLVELTYSFKYLREVFYWRRGVSPFIFIRKQKTVVFANILGHVYSYLMVPLISSFSSNLFVARFGATQSVFYALNSFVKSRGRNYWTKDNLLPQLLKRILTRTALEHIALVIVAIVVFSIVPQDISERFLLGSDLILYSLSMTVIVVLSTLVDLRRLKRPSYAGKASLIFVGLLLVGSFTFKLSPQSPSFLSLFCFAHIIYALILLYDEIFNNRMRV